MPSSGPNYPSELRAVVEHAKDLANVLHQVPRDGASDEAAPWIAGRANEILCFVGAVTRDWTAKRASTEKATRAIGGYLDSLHHELEARLGLASPSCCSSTLEATAGPPRRVRPKPRDESSRPGTTSLLLGLDLAWTVGHGHR
jgi:hypothetical protein